jgi:hypothetical protein
MKPLRISIALFLCAASVHAALYTPPADLTDRPASCTLAWDANTEVDLAGYRLYWGTASGAYLFTQQLSLVTTNTVTNLVAGQTWYFVVTAFNTSGLESGPSNEVSYRPPSQPKPPKGLRFWQRIIAWLRGREA